MNFAEVCAKVMSHSIELMVGEMFRIPVAILQECVTMKCFLCFIRCLCLYLYMNC